MSYYATGGGTLTIVKPIPEDLIRKLNSAFETETSNGTLDLYFDDKYHSDMDSLFEDLAPYVAGKIEFSGEDGTHWRITFKDSAYYEENGRMVYDSDPALFLSKDQANKLIQQLYRAALEDSTDGKPSDHSAEPSGTPPLRRISDVLRSWCVI